MTMDEALRQLDGLPYAWRLGKGKMRKREPMWGLELVRADSAGLVRGRGDPAFVIEGDSMEYCVTRAVAWHEQQKN